MLNCCYFDLPLGVWPCIFIICNHKSQRTKIWRTKGFYLDLLAFLLLTIKRIWWFCCGWRKISLVLRRFTVAEVSFFLHISLLNLYLHTQRINHLGNQFCSPQSSSGINVSWLIFLHPYSRSCLTEPILCCWWAGVAATSCRERPSQWTTPTLRAPCGPKNQHQRDRSWQTPKVKLSTEGSWPRRSRYQRLGYFPPASSTLFVEPIWHIWEDPGPGLHPWEHFSPHLVSSDQCTLGAWCWGVKPKCMLCDPSVWIT